MIKALLWRLKNIYKNEDTESVIKNVIGSFLIKGVALIVSMYTINAYLSYFSDNLYLGLWLTIVSILNWIMTFDFGLGNGLRNHLTRALAEKRNDAAKIYISSAYIILGVGSLLLLLISYLLSYILNWNQILNVTYDIIRQEELRTIMLISFTNVFLRFFLNLICSVLYALQKTVVINLITLITNISLLMFLFIIRAPKDTDALLKLSYIQLICTNLPLLLGTVLVFVFKLKGCQPSLRFFQKKAAIKVLSLGGMFFIAQIEMVLLNATNEFVINSIYGAESVVTYQFYYKVFSISIIIFSIISQPVWSAITKSVSSNNYKQVKLYEKMMYAVAGVGTLACIVVLLFLQSIFNFWLGNGQIEVNIPIALSFVLFSVASMFTNAATCLANGFGEVRTQVFYLLFAVAARFVFIMILVKFRFGDWYWIIMMNGILFVGMSIFQQLKNKKTLQKLLLSQ